MVKFFKRLLAKCRRLRGVSSQEKWQLEIRTLKSGMNVEMKVKHLGAMFIETDELIKPFSLKAMNTLKGTRLLRETVTLSLGLRNVAVIDKPSKQVLLSYPTSSMAYHRWSLTQQGVFALVFPAEKEERAQEEEEESQQPQCKWCCRVFEVKPGFKMERLLGALRFIKTYNEVAEKKEKEQNQLESTITPQTSEDNSLNIETPPPLKSEELCSNTPTPPDDEEDYFTTPSIPRRVAPWSLNQQGVFALVFPAEAEERAQEEEEYSQQPQSKWCCMLFEVKPGFNMEQLFGALQFMKTYKMVAEKEEQHQPGPTATPQTPVLMEDKCSLNTETPPPLLFEEVCSNTPTPPDDEEDYSTTPSIPRHVTPLKYSLSDTVDYFKKKWSTF